MKKQYVLTGFSVTIKKRYMILITGKQLKTQGKWCLWK